MKHTGKLLHKPTALLLAAAMLPLWGLPAAAADAYDFTLYANGAAAANTYVGGEVEVTLVIEGDADYTFYSMQDYVTFDTDYFELDTDSISVKKQLSSAGFYTDIFSAVPISVDGEYDRVFINRASLSGVDFAAEETVLTFTLTALAKGTTSIEHYRTEMLDADGARLTVNENAATVVIGEPSTELTVVTAPTATRITRGSALSSSTLSGGSVTTTDGVVVSGTWEWADGTQTFSKTGTYECTAVFTADNPIYGTIETTVTVTVYTSSSGGSSSSSSSSGSQATTSTTYNIVTPETSDNGNIVIDDSAKSGDTVTFTLVPDTGYKVYAVTVTDADGGTVAVTDNGDNTYTFTMPASEVSINAAFTALHTCSSESYTDVDTSLWYHEYIDYVIENGLMTGTSATTFEPNIATTRAMIVTILHRQEGEPEAEAAAAFDDVPSGEWYAAAVAWAAENGIVTGYDDTTFGPDDTITREQTAAILYRYANYKGTDTTASDDITGFSDYETVSAYAIDAIKWAVGAGIITGRDDGTLDPTGGATRAETAAMLMRFLEE